jgi:hypothetical protein
LKFSSTAKPQIVGVPGVGVALTVNTGTWTPAPTLPFKYQWLRNGVEIPDATAAKYVLTPADATATIQVKIKAVKDGYDDTWSKASKATKKIARGSLTAKSPVVKNKAGKDTSNTAPVFGQKLTASTPDWSPSETQLSYQWFRSGTKTAVGTGKTYTVQAKDIGKTLAVKVTGKKAGYTTVTKASKASKKVVKATLTSKTPVIKGEPALGVVLSAVTSGWGPDEVTLKYQWLRDGKAISKATEAKYTTDKNNDKGKSISVKVTGTLSGYTTVTKTSAQVKIGVLTAVTPKLANDSSGKDPVKYAPKAGETLSVTTGTWGPSPVSMKVEWYRSGTKAPVGTGETYTLDSADIAKTIQVKVTGSKTGYASVSKTIATATKVRAFEEIVLDGNLESPNYSSTPSSQKTAASITARAEAVMKAEASLMTLQETPASVVNAILAEAESVTGHEYKAATHSDQAVIWDSRVWERTDVSVVFDLSSAKGGLVVELTHIASGKTVRVASIHMPTLKSKGQPNGYANDAARVKDIKNIAKQAAGTLAFMGGDFNTPAHRAAIVGLGWTAALSAGTDTFDTSGTQAIDGVFAKGLTFSGTKVIDPGKASDHKWVTSKITIK